MSKTSQELHTVQKIVVFFDICSSTAILEDLLRTENHRKWRNLLIQLKEFLVKEQEETPFEIYKFLGDGWILLFDQNQVKGPKIMRFLYRLCVEYKTLFRSKIFNVLGGDYQVGVTFGMDSGTLVKIRMNERDEYIGRALNVAARLQGAIKQKDECPAGKLLVSKNCYAGLQLFDIPRYAGTLVNRRLSNVSGGERYYARKIVLCKS